MHAWHANWHYQMGNFLMLDINQIVKNIPFEFRKYNVIQWFTDTDFSVSLLPDKCIWINLTLGTIGEYMNVGVNLHIMSVWDTNFSSLMSAILSEFTEKFEVHSYLRSVTVATCHYIDVIMTTMASQITSLTIVYSTVYSDADQRKHQSSASLAFVWGIHRGRWISRTNDQ